MVTKLVVSLMSFVLLLSMTACNQALIPVVKVMVAKGEVDKETTSVVGSEQEKN